MVLLAEMPSELVQAMDSPEPAVRLDALRKIAIDYFSQSLPFLIHAAEDGDALVRERAVQGLGLFSGNPQALNPVKKALKDQDEFVRWRAVQAIGALGARDFVDDLIPLAKDSDWRIKASTLEVLGTVGHPAGPVSDRIDRLLKQGLEDRDERVKLAAACALAKGRSHEAFIPLLELLSKGSLFTREEAALAFGQLGNYKAVKPLIEALAEPRNHRSEEGLDWACWGIVKALFTLTGQNFGLNTSKWNEWYELNANK
jgi:HEAT repeat protein